MLSLNYEYRVVPAPRRAAKAKGARSGEERFALALSAVMNDLGAQGWEYVRSDTLPMDERAGLTGTKTSYLNMLVFRRVILNNSHAFDANGVVRDGGDVFFTAPMPFPALDSDGDAEAGPKRLAAE
jgi:hypothetical protein